MATKIVFINLCAMGVARIFQRGGHTDSYRGYSSDCHLNIVGCLLTKRLTKGGSRAPQDPSWLRPCVHSRYFNLDNGQGNFVYSYKQSILHVRNFVKSRCHNLTKICNFPLSFFQAKALE